MIKSFDLFDAFTHIVDDLLVRSEQYKPEKAQSLQYRRGTP